MINYFDEIFARVRYRLIADFPELNNRVFRVPPTGVLNLPTVSIELFDNPVHQPSSTLRTIEHASIHNIQVNVFSNRASGQHNEHAIAMFSIADKELALLGFTRNSIPPQQTATSTIMVGRYNRIVPRRGL